MNLEKSLDFSPLELLMMALVTVSGIIHIYVGLTAPSTVSQLILLAGAGYIGGLALFVYGLNRRMLALTMVFYTAAQIGAYYYYYGFAGSPIALADKVVQIVLIAAGIHYFREN